MNFMQQSQWSLYNRYVDMSSRYPQPAPGILPLSRSTSRRFSNWVFSGHGRDPFTLPWCTPCRRRGRGPSSSTLYFTAPVRTPKKMRHLRRPSRMPYRGAAADLQDTADQSYSLTQWVEPTEALAVVVDNRGRPLPVRPRRQGPAHAAGVPRKTVPSPGGGSHSTWIPCSFRYTYPSAHSFQRQLRLGIKTVSYYQALSYDQMLPKGIFRDKVVFVGLSLGSSPVIRHAVDEFLAPYPNPVPGVELHATTLDSLLRSRFIQEPFSTPLAVSLLGLALALAVAPLFYRQGAFLGLAIALGIIMVLVVSGYLFYTAFQVKIPVVTPAGIDGKGNVCEAKMARGGKKKKEEKINTPFIFIFI